MSLDSFISYVRTYDLARSNRFIFTILLPPKLIQYNYALESISLFAKDISSAFAWNLGTKGESQGTIPFNTPYSAFNEESSFILTLLNDGNMNIRHLFDDWATASYNPQTSKTEYYDNLRTTARLELLNQSDIPIYAWQFNDVLLDKIAPISLNNSENKLLEMTLTFSYRYWEKVPPTPVDYSIRQEGNALQAIYQIVKPYISSKYPALGRIEQNTNDIGIGIRALGSIFGIR